jgi:hypothetical protein
VKNVAVSASEARRAARIAAAEQGTSVSALVGAYLESVSQNDAEFLRLERLQNSALAKMALRGGLKMSENLTRDELHDRELIRRLNRRAAVS